jgi:hypothetical protein
MATTTATATSIVPCLCAAPCAQGAQDTLLHVHYTSPYTDTFIYVMPGPLSHVEVLSAAPVRCVVAAWLHSDTGTLKEEKSFQMRRFGQAAAVPLARYH